MAERRHTKRIIHILYGVSIDNAHVGGTSGAGADYGKKMETIKNGGNIIFNISSSALIQRVDKLMPIFIYEVLLI